LFFAKLVGCLIWLQENEYRVRSKLSGEAEGAAPPHALGQPGEFFRFVHEMLSS